MPSAEGEGRRAEERRVKERGRERPKKGGGQRKNCGATADAELKGYKLSTLVQGMYTYIYIYARVTRVRRGIGNGGTAGELIPSELYHQGGMRIS